MDATQRLSRTIWIGVGLLIVILCVSFVLSRYEPKSRLPAPPVLGQVADFSLTNQSNLPVTLASLHGRVWVADIIFSRCGGPCPQMMKRMKSLQDALPSASQAKLVTLTTDPVFDTPPILKAHGEKFGANTDRWIFLTGGKKEIVALAVDSLKLAALEKDPAQREDPNDLFIHSTYFVVVDKQARLRGVFQTTGEGVDAAKAQTEILALVRQLERER